MLEIKAMTTREAADRLGLHPRSISRLVESGTIVPAARLDLGPRGSFVFDPAEVDRVAGLRAKKAEESRGREMITADALARELGCTISDLDDLGLHRTGLTADGRILPIYESAIREEWSKRTGIDYTNELIRETTLKHRVQSVRAEVDFYELQCTCGHRLTSNSIVPEAARRRLYKSHALHVATVLMSVEAGE